MPGEGGDGEGACRVGTDVNEILEMKVRVTVVVKVFGCDFNIEVLHVRQVFLEALPLQY